MKENLLRLKRAIDRKYFASINGDETYPENLITLVSKMDTEGCVRFIIEMLNKTEDYLKKHDIEYDEIILNIQFSPYFHEKYEDRLKYIKVNKINPVSDLLNVNVNACIYLKNNKKLSIDPDDISENPYRDFIVSFRDFKEILSYLDIDLKSFTSFEDIKNKFWKDNLTTDEIVRGKKLELIKKK